MAPVCHHNPFCQFAVLQCRQGLSQCQYKVNDWDHSLVQIAVQYLEWDLCHTAHGSSSRTCLRTGALISCNFSTLSLKPSGLLVICTSGVSIKLCIISLSVWRGVWNEMIVICCDSNSCCSIVLVRVALMCRGGKKCKPNIKWACAFPVSLYPEVKSEIEKRTPRRDGEMRSVAKI